MLSHAELIPYVSLPQKTVQQALVHNLARKNPEAGSFCDHAALHGHKTSLECYGLCLHTVITNTYMTV